MASVPSPLLSVPPEIRLNVFRFVFADVVISATATSRTNTKEKPLEGYRPKTLYKGYPSHWQTRPEALSLSRQLREEALKVYGIELLQDHPCSQDSHFYQNLSAFVRNNVTDLVIPSGDFSTEKLNDTFPRLRRLNLNHAGMTTEVLTYKQGDNTFLLATDERLHMLCDLRRPPFAIKGVNPHVVLTEIIRGHHDNLIIKTCRKANQMVNYQTVEGGERNFSIIVRSGILIVTGQQARAKNGVPYVTGIDRYKEPYMIIDWDWDRGIVVERHFLETDLDTPGEHRAMKCLTDRTCACTPESLQMLKKSWSSFYGKLVTVDGKADDTSL